MAETPTPFTEEDVQSLGNKLRVFSGALTEGEQAVLSAILAPITSDAETSGYAFRGTFNINLSNHLNFNMAPPSSYALYAPGPTYAAPVEPTPYIPSLTYVDGIAYT
jgi:hypothetical protein